MLSTPSKRRHDSHTHCTMLLDMHYRGVLLLQAAPDVSPCMSVCKVKPPLEHSPTLTQAPTLQECRMRAGKEWACAVQGAMSL